MSLRIGKTAPYSSSKLPHLLMALVCCLLLPFAAILASPPDTSFSRLWTWSGDGDVCIYVQGTREGGSIATGTTTFGDGVYQMWVAKIDELGNITWEWFDGGPGTEGGDTIEQMADGSYILSGESNSYTPRFAWFLMKIDPQGNEVWTRVLESTNNYDWPVSAQELPGGDIISAGSHYGDPTLWRLGPDGQDRWVQRYGNQLDQELTEDANVTRDGDFLITGLWQTGESGQWLFILKTDGDGNLLWRNQYHTSEQQDPTSWGYCVAGARNGDVLAGGWSFELGNNYYIPYLVRTDESGDVIWDRIYPEFYGGVFRDMVELPSGEILLSGEWYSLAHGQYEVLLVKTDSEGNVLWENRPEGGMAWAVDQTLDGGFVVGGPHALDGWYSDSDGFHLVKFNPEIKITLLPATDTVPEQGGPIPYQLHSMNTLDEPISITAWTRLVGPWGQVTLLDQAPLDLQPGDEIILDDIVLNVPDTLSGGDYTFSIHYGEHPQEMMSMGYGSFDFHKEGEVGVDEPAQGNPLEVPQDFSLLAAVPNPFNSQTRLTLRVPTADRVQVDVFDVAGRRVAVLADRTLPPGEHALTFDGAGLASGMYFIQATAPSHLDQVQKVMLVR